MATDEPKANTCIVCAEPITPGGAFLEIIVRGYWAPICSLHCLERYFAIGTDTGTERPSFVSGKVNEEQPV